MRDGKLMVTTPKGEDLVDLVDEQLKSPELTAAWEQQLLMIEQGRPGWASFGQG